VYVVFLLNDRTIQVIAVDVGPRGVSMGPLSADTQPPPPPADSAWFLTQNSGFAGYDDGRKTKPGFPQTPFLRTGNRNGTRTSISLYLRFQKP
jgi:hypothetical protein